MIPIENRERLPFVESDEDQGSESCGSVRETITYLVDLCQKLIVKRLLTDTDALCNLGHREIAVRRSAPLSAGKCPDIDHVVFSERRFVPYSSSRYLLP